MYIKTEHFYINDIEKVADGLRRRGYEEEWSIICPYLQEIRMYNLLENKTALLRVENKHIVVDYTRGDRD